jgi:SAM-dependent methyltransferase
MLRMNFHKKICKSIRLNESLTALREMHISTFLPTLNYTYKETSSMQLNPTATLSTKSSAPFIYSSYSADDVDESFERVRYKPAIVEPIDEDEMDFDENEGDDPDPRLIIGKNLLAMGKTMYRHIEPVPMWFTDRKQTITAFRTTGQIRRCLQDWMIKVDREMNAKFRDKKLGWNVGPVNAERAAADVHIYGPEETIAYAHFFMQARYSITRKILRDVKLLRPTFKPTRIIDFGCGPGTAGAAAYEVWGEDIGKYVGIDMSRSMIEASKIMFENWKSVDAVFWEKTADVVKRARDRGERYDMAIVSYTLSELTNDNARRAATQIMYELLDVGGILIIIEPGNPVGSFAVRSARKLILENFNEGVEDLKQPKTIRRFPGSNKTTQRNLNHEVNPPIELVLESPGGLQYSELQASVLAPCVHDKACPLAPGSFCSFSQKVSFVYSPQMFDRLTVFLITY